MKKGFRDRRSLSSKRKGRSTLLGKRGKQDLKEDKPSAFLKWSTVKKKKNKTGQSWGVHFRSRKGMRKNKKERPSGSIRRTEPRKKGARMKVVVGG